MAGASKSATAPRRVSSSLSKVSTPPAAAAITTTPPSRLSKASKQSKVVRIKLPKESLSRFPHETARKPSQAKTSPLSASTTILSDEPKGSTTVKSEPDTVPALKANAVSASSSKDSKDLKQEDLPLPKTGMKRQLDADVESDSKEKPKTNPRKRPKAYEPTPSHVIAMTYLNHRDPHKPDGRTAAAKLAKGLAGAPSGPTHKLGPKANQGAINAGLRALDRTGKPCRKWEKTGFRVKTFTGRTWEIPSWRAPSAKAFGSEADSTHVTSNSLSKDNSSSNLGSDKSPAINNSFVPSSPLPALATPA